MFEVYINYVDYADKMEVYIFRQLGDEAREFLESMDEMRFRRWDDTQLVEKPTFTIPTYLGKPFIQAVVDKAAEIGIMPTGKPVLENELTATKYHLEDMRKLVFRE